MTRQTRLPRLGTHFEECRSEYCWPGMQRLMTKNIYERIIKTVDIMQNARWVIRARFICGEGDVKHFGGDFEFSGKEYRLRYCTEKGKASIMWIHCLGAPTSIYVEEDSGLTICIDHSNSTVHTTVTAIPTLDELVRLMEKRTQ